MTIDSMTKQESKIQGTQHELELLQRETRVAQGRGGETNVQSYLALLALSTVYHVVILISPFYIEMCTCK